MERRNHPCRHHHRSHAQKLRVMICLDDLKLENVHCHTRLCSGYKTLRLEADERCQHSPCMLHSWNTERWEKVQDVDDQNSEKLHLGLQNDCVNKEIALGELEMECDWGHELLGAHSLLNLNIRMDLEVCEITIEEIILPSIP